jgi:hypothetical protein
MNWVRHAILDLAITAVVLIAAIGGQSWAMWIVWIYTPLLLLLKAAALLAPPPRKAEPVPDLVYHLLYGISLVALLYVRAYWPAAGWGAIWLLSAIQAARIPKKG